MFEKDMTFGGNNGQIFQLRCHMKDGDQNLYRLVDLQLSRIDYLAQVGTDMSEIVLLNGKEVSVNLPLDSLKKKLEEASFNGGVDLSAETAPESFIESLKNIFDQVAKGKRSGDAFDIRVYSYNNKYEISSMDIYNVSESEGNAYLSCTGSNSRYLYLPIEVFNQLYTHAVETRAQTLDLYNLTDPNSMYQKDRALFKHIEKRYSSTNAPRRS